MSECIILIASAKIPAEKKMRFQLVQNNTFCPTPNMPHPPTIKVPPNNKK